MENRQTLQSVTLEVDGNGISRQSCLDLKQSSRVSTSARQRADVVRIGSWGNFFGDGILSVGFR